MEIKNKENIDYKIQLEGLNVDESVKSTKLNDLKSHIQRINKDKSNLEDELYNSKIELKYDFI